MYLLESDSYLPQIASGEDAVLGLPETGLAIIPGYAPVHVLLP